MVDGVADGEETVGVGEVSEGIVVPARDDGGGTVGKVKRVEECGMVVVEIQGGGFVRECGGFDSGTKYVGSASGRRASVCSLEGEALGQGVECEDGIEGAEESPHKTNHTHTQNLFRQVLSFSITGHSVLLFT